MASWLALRAAVHDLGLDEQNWLEALQTEVREFIDEGFGTFVYSYCFDRDLTIRLGRAAGCDTAPGLWQALASWGGDNARALAGIYRTGPGSLVAATQAAGCVGASLSKPGPAFEAHGVADVFTVLGHDLAGFGVFLTAPRARPCFELPPMQRRAFERLSVELAAAVRLRKHYRRVQLGLLSASEKRVARLLANGASDKSIAFELGVTISTVSTFTSRLREKLGYRLGQEVLLLRPRTRATDFQRRLGLLDRLTNTECDVASALLVGSSYREIAERRGVSVRTVASQCSAVFRKCDVSGRRELAAALLGK